MKRTAVLAAIILLTSTLVFGQGGPGYLDGGYVAASGGGGPQNYSINRMVFTMDATITHFHDTYTTAVNEAHEVLELGTGKDVPEFAWVSIDSVTGYDNSVWVAYTGRWNDERFNGTAGNWNITDTTITRLLLFNIDWAEYIPAGATILSAGIHFNTDNQWYFSDNDTIGATLMTNTTDSDWYAIKGVSNGTDMAPNMSHANWRYQQAGNATLATWGYQPAPRDVWVPELKTRTSFEDWGNVSDWTGFLAATDPPGDTEVVLDIKNCVQAAVNGEVNNGIATYVKNGASSGGYKYNSPEPRPGLGSFDKVPWFSVTYSTMPYRPPFPGGEFVFVFTTDDGKIIANETYADVFDEFGWKYSAYYAQTHFDTGANTPTAASMLALLGRGFEVGSHSRRHLSPYGVAQWEAETSVAQAESLVRDTDPAWLHNKALLYDGDARETHQYFGKSFACPQNQLDRAGVIALAGHGYAGIRLGTERKPSATGVGNYFTEMTFSPVTSDSMRLMGIPGDELREQNMLGVAYSLSVDAIVGAKTIHPTETEIKWNFRRMIRKAVAEKSKVISIYTHDFKSGGYTNGLDEDELRWMLEVVRDEGGTCMRLSDFVAWKKQYSTAVATPAGYAQVDSTGFIAEDAVWFKPKPLNRLYPYEGP